MPIIEIRNLSKWYGLVLGVSNVTIDIEPGVTGLLGPNGAGKSTLLKLLTGQLKPDTGTITVNGIPSWNNTRLFEHIGFCPDLETFYDWLTGFEFLLYMARLHGASRKEAHEQAKESLESMELVDAANQRIGAYSKGMRQRIKFAQSTLHHPDLLFLDEPLSGMDPVLRMQTIDIIRSYGREEKTVVVSSHILHEVEEMTNRILVLNNGQLLAEGTVEEIRELIDEQPRRIQITTPNRQHLTNLLIGSPEVQTISFDDDPDVITIQTPSPDSFFNTIEEIVLREKITIQQISTLDDNLESVFDYLVKAK